MDKVSLFNYVFYYYVYLKSVKLSSKVDGNNSFDIKYGTFSMETIKINKQNCEFTTKISMETSMTFLK